MSIFINYAIPIVFCYHALFEQPVLAIEGSGSILDRENLVFTTTTVSLEKYTVSMTYYFEYISKYQIQFLVHSSTTDFQTFKKAVLCLDLIQ